MKKRAESYLIGIDGNEANVEHRVGVNQFAYGLLGGLWATKTADQFVVYLSTPPVTDLPKEKTNWHYRVIGPSKFWTQWRLPLDLFSHFPRPDVFFSPSHYAPRFSPVPTVVSIMDLGFLDSREQFTLRDYLQLKDWTAYSVMGAQRVIAISEATKKEIINKYRVPEVKIAVVYPGYESKRFFVRRGEQIARVLAKYSIRQPYLLFLGSLKPSKNVVRLVGAFGKCVKRGLVPGNVKLVVSGKKAWLYEEIFEEVKTLGLGKRVIFTGFFPEKDLPYLMAGSQAFLMPSLFEGFGIPAVEAMASGVPVVVSKVASLPEVVGKAGVYVNPYSVDDIAKALVQVTNLGGTKRTVIVNEELKQAKKFSWFKAAAQTVNILENAIR